MGRQARAAKRAKRQLVTKPKAWPPTPAAQPTQREQQLLEALRPFAALVLPADTTKAHAWVYCAAPLAGCTPDLHMGHFRHARDTLERLGNT